MYSEANSVIDLTESVSDLESDSRSFHSDMLLNSSDSEAEQSCVVISDDERR